MLSRCALLLNLFLIPEAIGFREYADRIPNGPRVPHPCKDNFLWHGVGHLNSQGGGSTNVFGLHFSEAGHKWTVALCSKDSDGDGKTNGEELGDPKCNWQPGNIPQYTSSISHPGICEPIDSKKCRKKSVPDAIFSTQEEWIRESCKSSEFVCDALNKTDGVRKMTIRMPPTPVPAQETTYMCVIVEFENLTGDFHMIATTPVVNNSYVMHHMLLFGCPDDRPVQGPFPCRMGGCRDLLGAWALGLTGQCFHPEAGIRMGRNGFKRLLLEYHWNNPTSRADFVDSSGMTLYYTPNLRPNDMAMLMTGQNFIEIPPHADDVMVTSDCSATCTRNLMKNEIRITSAANHMHYLGKRMSIQHYRDGKLLQYITNDQHYNYDTPNVHTYENPLVIKPGDMVRTVCHFSSAHKNVTTFWGYGTSDEMCYGFMEFYPVKNMPQAECTTWRSLSDCDPETEMGCTGNEIRRLKSNFSQSRLYEMVTGPCTAFDVCTAECKAAIMEAISQEPCMKNEDVFLRLKLYFLERNYDGIIFLEAMEPCNLDINKAYFEQTRKGAIANGQLPVKLGVTSQGRTVLYTVLGLIWFESACFT